MPRTFWPVNDLSEARADNATSLFDEMVAGFEERTRPAPKPDAVPEPKPAPMSFSIDRTGLIPWAESASNAVQGAAGAVKQAATGLFDRAALTPWREPEKPQQPATGTPSAMPSASTGGFAGAAAPAQGDVADVTPDEPVTRESVTRSAAAALRKAGLPVEMAPYIAGIAINEGILQPGTIARDNWSVGGVKAPGSAGVVTVPTREVIDGQSVMQEASFGAFNSMQDGMDALATFVRDSPRFGPVAQQAAKTGDYAGMIEGFRQNGYATDPDWTTKVTSIASGLPVPQTAAQARPAQGASGAIRVVPNAQPNSYWTSEGTHGGAPAADIFADEGSPIVAPVSGVSEPAVYRDGGNTTTIRGDDGRYYYLAHGHVPFVGGRVDAGQAIGQVGRSGNARDTAPHLHYAIASDPSVFGAKNGSGDIEDAAYWKASPNAGGASTPAASPPAPAGSPPPAGATSQIGAGDEQFGPNSVAMKTSQIGVPFPEDASIEESGAASANQPQNLPPPLRNIVPYDEQTGRTGYADLQRAPLADGESLDPSMLPGDGGTAPQTYEQPYDPDQGPREATPGSVGAQPLPQEPATLDQLPPDEELAPRTQEDTRPYYGPETPATPAIGAAQNAGAGLEADHDLAPRPGIIQAGADTYGQALGEVGQKHDEIQQATAARRTQEPEPTSDVDRGIRDAVWAATDALGATNRAMDIVNTVLMTTPQAGADVINAALARAGIGRDEVGVTVLGQRVGIADIVDLGPFTNIGIGRASGMAVPAGAVQYGTGVAAGGIERGASAAINAGREALGNAGSAIRRGAEAVGDAWEQGRATARRAEALDTGGGAFGTLGVSPGGEPRRMYHGTAGEFGRPDPEQFDPNGLFGPGYYLTSDPRVAGGIGEPRFAAVNPATGTTLNPDGTTYTTGDPSRLLRSGYAQARAINNLTMDQAYEVVDEMLSRALGQRGYYSMGTLDSLMDLHADLSSGRLAKNPAVTPSYVLDRAASILGVDNPAAGKEVTEIAGRMAPGANVRAVNVPEGLRLLDIDAPMRTNPGLLDEVEAALGDPDQVRRFREAMRDQATRERTGPMQVVDAYRGLEQSLNNDKAAANRILAAAGYDGITHEGGKRIPMRDKFGDPIEHDVNIVFPHALDKITNAFSGEVGGATFGITSGRGTGVGAQALTDVSNSLGGSVFGAAAGAAMPADSEEQRRANALTGAGLGLVGGPVAGRIARRGGGALATPGITPNGPRPNPSRPTVEVIEARIETAMNVAERARANGNTRQAERAMDVVRGLESDLVDAMNARRALEPAIESDIGRRVERMPYEPDVRTDPYTTERVATTDELSGPVSIPTGRPNMQNAVLPFDPASAAAGGAAGAMSGEEGEEPDPGRTAAGMAVAGMLGNRQLRMAGRRWSQAQAKAAVQAAAARAAGKAPPATAADWLRSVGYSGMIGPSTGIVNAVGNGMELLYAVPKEITRSLMRGAPREAWQEARGMAAGFMRAGGEMLDALAGAHPGGGVENAALSQRVQNPLGRLAAQLIEAPTRVFSEVPDAFYRSIAGSMGESRAAAQIATSEGLKGSAWSRRVNDLLVEVQNHKAGQLTLFPQQVDQIIKDGDQLAERMTLRGEVGPRGKAFKQGIDALPFGLGNLVMPFFNTPYQMMQRQLERTPVGLKMGTQPSKFDKRYDVIVGSALGLGTVGLAAGGMVTGSGPDDTEKRKMLQSQGWQGNSTLVGGVWIPNNAFGVFGPMLDLAGEIGDGLRYQKKDVEGRDLGLALLKRAGAVVSNQVYMRGVSDLIKAIKDPGTQLEAYAAQNLSRLIPMGATARTIGNMTDPLERQTEKAGDVGSVESIRQRVARGLPGQGLPIIGGREGLPAAQDVLGRDQENDRRGLAALGPKTRTPKRDAAIQAFTDAGVDIGGPAESLSLGQGVQIELTPAEQRYWLRERGKLLEQYASKFTDAPWWQNPESRQKGMQTLIADANKAANGQVMLKIGTGALQRRASEAVEKKRRAS